MAVKDINKIKEPTIILDEISIPDFETTEGIEKNKLKESNGVVASKLYGTKYPIIQFNGKIWEPQSILSVTINSTAQIPTIYIELFAVNNYVKNEEISKERNIVSIYIDSRKDGIKPIRNDYLITYYSNVNNVIKIYGVLDIPSWKNEKNQALKGTSLDVLQKISDEYKLGFATNIESTNDSMIWYQLNKTVSSLLYDIESGSYINDNTFFDVFIDNYYILNFVNLSNSLEDKEELDSAWIDSIALNPASVTKGEIIGEDSKLMLTNHKYYESTSVYISSYKIIDNSGEVENSEGEQRNIYFYNLQDDVKWELEVKTETSPENLASTKSKKKWLGIVDSDNMHKNYLWQKGFSIKSKKEINKKSLDIVLNTINFNLHRGQKIPIIISKQNFDPDLKSPVTNDEALTGWYVINSISYHFERGVLSQKINLIKKDWKITTK